MLGWVKKILGISQLERRVENLEELFQKRFKTKPETIKRDERKILKILEGKMTTSQIAKKLNKSRSWISLLINKLEREGRVKEVGKKGRAILYEKV